MLAWLKLRVVLILLGLALVACFIWFAGPFFAFADRQPLASPVATATFPVRNEARERRVLRLEADAYAIPPREPCDSEDWGEQPKPAHDEIERRRRRLAARHARNLFPVPAGWTVEITPAELALGAGEQRDVTVRATAPDGFRGTQPINVNAFHGDRLIGGVTLHVTGDANA